MNILKIFTKIWNWLNPKVDGFAIVDPPASLHIKPYDVESVYKKIVRHYEEDFAHFTLEKERKVAGPPKIKVTMKDEPMGIGGSVKPSVVSFPNGKIERSYLVNLAPRQSQIIGRLEHEIRHVVFSQLTDYQRSEIFSHV